MTFTRQQVEELSARLGEPGWLTDRRLESFGYFEKLELPGEKEEAWRYTDLRRLKFSFEPFSPEMPDPAHTMTADQEALLREEGERDGYVIQRDADIVHTELSPALSEKGVILTSLDTAIKEHEQLVRPNLFSSLKAETHIFEALHGAFFTGGTFLFVPRGVSVGLPLESQRWIDEAGAAMFPRTLIIVEDGAEVTYFERWHSTKLNSPSLSIGGAEIVCGQASRVSFITLQEFGQDVWSLQTQHARIQRDATYRSLVVALGGRFSRSEVGTLMAGEGDSVEMLGLYFAEKGQHFDFRTLQDHAAPRCNSDLLYKGALKDHSHSVYSGLINVRPPAEGTDAYQTNRNLVLSDHARADSKPELEIQNNDVRCSHGASVGQINEDELFYLESRGIPRSEAEKLIVFGFFEEVIARISNEEIRQVLLSSIDRKLGL